MRMPVLPLAFIALLSGGVPFALAQQDALGGFQHDSSQPIEISSDALEVRQQEQTAVFTGAVDARQGDVRMQAERLIVSYDPDQSDGGDTGAIRRVRAEGNVFISSRTETAEGNWAEYDVATGTIVMGDDVALTQGPQNVLVGGKLRIDLNSGFARIESGGVRTDGSRGRVEAIFSPASAN